MATTNREFDDAHALEVIERKTGIKIPEDVSLRMVTVTYSSPVRNAASVAQVHISVYVTVDAATADEILGV